MAREWIKMRADLMTHPRFLTLTNQLIYGEDIGFLAYAIGEENLGIDVYPPSNENVTERALRCVTISALRDVTLVCLMRVWWAVNNHCKVSETDAVMSPMTLDDLDDISLVSGFGIAMKASGWVVDKDCNTLVFKNFLEYNEPACVRMAPKTNKERQAEFRQRKREQQYSVTKVTKRNGREEKRREENNTPPFIPPEGETRKRFVPPSVEEVAAYCRERGNSIDAEYFIAHYGAKGWKCGKSNTPMTNWKQAVITWEKNRERDQRPQPAQQPPANPEVVWRAINSVGWDAKALETKVGREWVGAVDAVGGWSVLRDVRGEFAIQQLNKKLAAEYARIRNGDQS